MKKKKKYRRTTCTVRPRLGQVGREGERERGGGMLLIINGRLSREHNLLLAGGGGGGSWGDRQVHCICN